MRHLTLAIAGLLSWFGFSSEIRAAAGDEPSAYRALIIVETSKEMARRQEIVLRTLHDLLDKQFKTFLRPGDQLDFWTFGKRLNINAVPPQKWNPEEVPAIASQMAKAVVMATPDKKPDLGQVMAALPGISRGVKDNVVFLLLTGEQMIRGTPLDESVNRVFIAHAPGMEEARKPFVLVLVSRDGRWVGESVSPGGHAIHIPAAAIRAEEPEEIPETPLASEPATLSVPKPTTLAATSGTVAVESVSNQPVVIVEPEDPVEVPVESQPAKATKPLSVEEITAMIAAQQRIAEAERTVPPTGEETATEVGGIESVTPPLAAQEMATTVGAAELHPPVEEDVSVPDHAVGARVPLVNAESKQADGAVVKENEPRPVQPALAAVPDSPPADLAPGPAKEVDRGELALEPAPEPKVESESSVDVTRREGGGVLSEAQTASAVESPDEDQEASGIALGAPPPPNERPSSGGRQAGRDRALPIGWLNLSAGVLLLGGVVLLLGWTLRRRSTHRFEPSYISRSFDRDR